MLVSVVKNGLSIKSAIPGYLIGGKTGTAQIPNPNGAGYSSENIHSFLVAAPINDPQFVILVKLDKVKAVKFSSDSSSPIARQILEFLFDYYNILPTEEATEKEKAQYKMYADRLKVFLGSESAEQNPQEANATSNIQKKLDLAENSNKNDNVSSKKKSKKYASPGASGSSIHASINSGAGD